VRMRGGFVDDGKRHVEECGALITGFVLVLDLRLMKVWDGAGVGL